MKAENYPKKLYVELCKDGREVYVDACHVNPAHIESDVKEVGVYVLQEVCVVERSAPKLVKKAKSAK